MIKQEARTVDGANRRTGTVAPVHPYIGDCPYKLLYRYTTCSIQIHCSDHLLHYVHRTHYFFICTQPETHAGRTVTSDLTV
jgi:hypothetical protein